MTTFRYPSGNSNGQTLDAQGRLITCEHGTRRVTRTEPDRPLTVLASRFETRRLSSPNDVVVRNDGTISSTDPPYWLPNQSRDKQVPFNVAPDGTGLVVLLTDLERANGLAFSPDQKRLHLIDSAPRLINAYPVSSGGSLGNERVFAELPAQEMEQGGPDGIKVDVEDNAYSTGPSGLWIFSPKGTLMGRQRTPGIPTHCGWGDPDWKGLYMTSRTGFYRMRMNISGLLVGVA